MVTVSPDFILSHDNSAAIIKEFRKLAIARVRCAAKIVIVLDHVVPASSEKYAQNHKDIREFVEEQGIAHFFDVQHGICHQVFSENGFALPGKLILGADSHTTSYGAFGAFSAGIGRSEAASVWATDEIWLKVPETIRIEMTGKIPAMVFAKDVILTIIGEEGADRVRGGQRPAKLTQERKGREDHLCQQQLLRQQQLLPPILGLLFLEQ